jgi:hypothetical protein
LKIDTFVIFHHTSLLKKGRKVRIQLKPDDFYFCSPASGVRLVVISTKDIHQRKTGSLKVSVLATWKLKRYGAINICFE